MFFNPCQQTALAAIVDSLEMFGSPSVYADGGRLRVKVKKLDNVIIKNNITNKDLVSRNGGKAKLSNNKTDAKHEDILGGYL